MNEKNEGIWEVSLTLEAAAVAVVDAAFEEAGALSVASFELEEGGAWTMTALFEGRPDGEGLSATLAQTLGGTAPALSLAAVEDRDWIAETVRAFPPLPIGPFWVHGGHVAPPDTTRIPLLIDAGIAFGSGEHATTEACLLALARLGDEGRAPASALDMGCGSGILAIAAVKLYGCAMLAVDIDAASVAFAREAAIANGTGAQIVLEAGDGYAAPQVVRRAPFDLVMANILANPLIAMAGDLAGVLRPGGTAILSGLLVDQAPAVIAAHEAAGLRLLHQDDLRGWSALVMAIPA
ncbi:MAG: 50S ribosomal protein L11 methyltransferase [Proteobacteria bacterium]|nr:50S ribosomal protein L11 methyltransferase [Pseudomonadota bacterium]